MLYYKYNTVMNDKDYRYSMAIIIRKDLDMRCGKIAVQVGHGVVIGMLNTSSVTISRWYNEGMRKIVLKTHDKIGLETIEDQCRVEKIACNRIYDAGHTQVEPNTWTGIVIGIDTVERVNHIISGLSLL